MTDGLSTCPGENVSRSSLILTLDDCSCECRVIGVKCAEHLGFRMPASDTAVPGEVRFRAAISGIG
jgi:hypothetical protein